MRAGQPSCVQALNVNGELSLTGELTLEVQLDFASTTRAAPMISSEITVIKIRISEPDIQNPQIERAAKDAAHYRRRFDPDQTNTRDGKNLIVRPDGKVITEATASRRSAVRDRP